MKTDIFEDMKERVGCENISDLPYRKRMVWEIIKQHSPLDYPKEQLEKFSHYVFGVDYAVIMGILDMITPMVVSWKWTTNTYLPQAAYSAISKGVMWYRRNANLYRQSWKIQ